MVLRRRLKVVRWWRRAGTGLRFLLFLMGCLGLAFLVYAQRPEEESEYLGSSLQIILLVNLNIIILCVLAFLVGRNVVKLIFDRRRKILGSKLRMRLVVAFVGLTLVPAGLLFILASGLLNRAIDGWFSNKVETAVSGARNVARIHYNLLEETTRRQASEIALAIYRQSARLKKAEAAENFLDDERKQLGFFSLTLFKDSDTPWVDAKNAAANVESFSEPAPDPNAIKKARKGDPIVLFENREASQFVRAYLPLLLDDKPAVLLASMRVNPELAQAFSDVNESYTDYEKLKFSKSPLKSSYLLSLAMISGLILFSAIWFGFYMAREISVPIQRLAEGTRALARGNYEFQIKGGGDDEVGLLVESFNTMISDLKASRHDAESRRLYIETILANLAVGVIAIDPDQRVTSVNAAAARLFNIEEGDASVPGFASSRTLAEVLKSGDLEQVEPLLEQLDEKSESPLASADVVERQIVISSQGRELKVILTAGRVLDASARYLGTVFLFDDITDLVKAQHMSAWREVARRIAHEIKNPLTPIQLSAQRLERLLSDTPSHAEAVKECTETIVEHVSSIKRLANEFSNFARMPTAEFKLSNLNLLISDTISPFAENNQGIVFQFIADNKLPDIMMDHEQIRRVLINLIDNAISALQHQEPSFLPEVGPTLVLKTFFDRKQKMAGFEVSDNGPGISPVDKIRIFEPYFTTKKGGTGLGLAIVTTIVSDHQGDIKVYDNPPRGTKFIVELPLMQKSVTQRRLSSS